MPSIAIRHTTRNTTLHTGNFRSTRACIESAIACGIDLSGADLRHANLAHATLDGAKLKGARFDHANLVGANISEAALNGAVFAHAGLQNACLCFSDLTGCDFTGALFGATDIAGASLDNAIFSTSSAFTLNFRDAESLEECRFMGDSDRAICRFSRPPLVLTGLAHTVVVLDRDIRIGSVAYPAETWLRPDKILPKAGPGLYPFTSALRRSLRDLLLMHGLDRAGSLQSIKS